MKSIGNQGLRKFLEGLIHDQRIALRIGGEEFPVIEYRVSSQQEDCECAVSSPASQNSTYCWIDGHLFIQGGTFKELQWLDKLELKFPISFVGVVFKDLLSMRDVTSSYLSFSNCIFENSVVADRIHVESTLQFFDCEIKAGVRICGADIHGNLDFKGCNITAGMFTTLRACDDKGKTGEDLDKFYAVHAGGASVRGNVLMTHARNVPDVDPRIARTVKFGGRFRAKGCLYFSGIRVARDFKLNGASIQGVQIDDTAPNTTKLFDKVISEKISGCALEAVNAQIDGDMLFRPSHGERFSSKGEIRLINSEVGGDVEMMGAELIAPNFFALTADGIDVKGTTFLKGTQGFAFKCDGIIRFVHASLHEGLLIKQAEFTNTPFAGQVPSNARQYYKDKITGIFQDNEDGRPIFYGGLNATMADIGGTFAWENVRLKNDKIRVDLSKSESEIISIINYVDVADVRRFWRFYVIFLAIISIALLFVVNEFLFHIETVFEMTIFSIILAVVISFIYNTFQRSIPQAHEEKLRGFWPDGRNVRLQLFKYKTIKNIHECKAWYISWVLWSVRNSYTPQPFRHLEAILRGHGHFSSANVVGYVRELSRLEIQNNTIWECVKLRFLGATIGFGYQLWRLFFIFLVWMALSTAVFSAACNDYKIVKAPTPERDYQPGFNPLYYALDTIVPVVSLGQTQYWLPNANPNAKQRCDCYGQLDSAALGGGLYKKLRANTMASFVGEFAEILAVWNPILGWIFASLAVVGISGIVKKDE